MSHFSVQTDPKLAAATKTPGTWNRDSYWPAGEMKAHATGLLHLWYQDYCVNRASLVAQLVKNLPAIKETLVRFLAQEDPLEKG